MGKPFRRGKGWTQVVDVPSDTAKRKQRWVSGRTQAELKTKINAIIAQVETGTYAPPSKLTVGDVLDGWLEEIANQVRPVTLRGYRSNANKLRQRFGQLPVSHLRPEHLSQFYSETLASGVSAYVAVNMHRVISEALTHAMRLNLVVRNIAQAVRPPRPRTMEKVTADSDGVSRLLIAARDSELYPLVALTLATGLRRSEVLGLQWRDIELDAAELRVERGLHVLKGGQVVYEAPKSATSRRTVALPPSACIALRAHRERMEARSAELLGATLKPETPLFVRPDFSPIRPDYVSHAFRKIAKKAGLTGLRFHDLRHSHATLLLGQDIHPLIVSRRLGHSSIGITLDLYSHPGMDLQAKAAQAFDIALTPNRAGERAPTPM